MEGDDTAVAEGRTYHEVNREKLAAHFSRGETYSRKLGVRIEHVLDRANAGGPVPYSGPDGVKAIMERLAPAYEQRTYEGDMLVRLAKPRQAVSLGAGGQLELSLGPYANVADIEREYLDFRNNLDPILDEFGINTPMLGYNPATRASNLELVPQLRYVNLDAYLAERTPMGACMMRSAAALQVAVDYENEADAVRKMRLAQVIAPILALMCDNSPVFEGAPRTCNMVRTKVWDELGQERAGTVPGSLKIGYTLRDYADYILSREAVLVPDEEAESGWRAVGSQTFDEVYATREMSDAEIDHALSMVWPDARLKYYLEIRAADAMPLEYALSYVTLIKGLFYSKRNLDVIESLLGAIGEAHVRQAKNALMAKGYGAEIYGRPASFWADLLIVLASGSLEPDEAAYFEPLSSMVRYRFTLAEIWPRLMEKRRHMPAGSPSAPVVGVVPRYDFEWTGLAISDGYLSGLLQSGCIPIVLPATSDPSLIADIVSACDGFLIPGGQDIDPARYGKRREGRTQRSATARDEMEEALICAVIDADKPLLGVCRGMQSLNVALGGTLHQDVRASYPDSTVVHVQGLPFSEPSHFVDIDPASKLAAYVGATHIDVASLHHQCVDEVGEGLTVVATCPDDGMVEAVEMPDKRFVIGVQWHPEHTWSTREHSRNLFKAFVDACAASRDAVRAE